MDTEYTKGFKSGMAFEQERIIKLLEEIRDKNYSEMIDPKYSAQHMCFASDRYYRAEWALKQITLIKGEINE